jgi:hypothetical protein
MTPSRNNTGIAHENGAIEGPHGHLKRAMETGQLPEMAALRVHFAPDPAALPNVEIHLVPRNVYEAMIGAGLTMGDAA